ncbi:MAG: TRAP transporter fused permease subunit [Desulfobacterales bacterium]|nr:TRAP transporter fused permease subunit [Desulfobacterales bacterium]
MKKSTASEAGRKTHVVKYVTSHILVLWCALVLIGHLPSYLGGYIPVPQALALPLFIVMFLYALSPGKASENAAKWVDWVPLALSLPAVITTALFYEVIENYEAFGMLDTKGVVISMMLAVGLLWAAWRVTSPVLAMLLGGMLLLVRFQFYLPGMLHGRGYAFDRLGYAFFVGSEGVFGLPFYIACTVLVMFIVFGQLFQRSGGGDWFLRLAASILGKAHGGMAKTSIMASFFFGMISGSPAANTATTGAITIPAMKETGYSSNLAGAVEAVASTGGQIMPPVMGAIAFIMAEWLLIPYSKVVLSAAIPAVLYFVMVFSGIHFEALKSNRQPMVREENAPSFFQILLAGWFYLIPIGVLIFLLLAWQIQPALAGVASVFAMIGASFFSRDRNHWLFPKRIGAAINQGLEKWLTVGLITASVGMMVGSLAISGLGIRFSSFIIDVTGGNLYIIMLAVAAGCFVLGMGLDSIPMYITMAILTAPALINIGVPDIAAHLFVIYWGMTSFITPPVCIAVYVACGISNGDIWRTGGHAIRLGVGFFLIPFAFVISPALLGIGSVPRIALAVVTALLGGVALSSALMGYAITRMTAVQRILQALGGVILILRDWRLEVLGLLLLGISLIWQYTRKRNKI